MFFTGYNKASVNKKMFWREQKLIPFFHTPLFFKKIFGCLTCGEKFV